MMSSSNDPSTPPTQRSIGELVASIKDELVGIVHHEVDIAKKELKVLGTKTGIVAACGAVVLFLLLSAWVMLLFAAAHGLMAAGLPAWASYLIVAGVFVLIALIAALVAYLVAKRITAPEVTIETARGAVDAVKGQRHSSSVTYDDAFEELYGKRAPISKET